MATKHKIVLCRILKIKKMYKTEIYEGATLLGVGIGLTQLASLDGVQSAFLSATVKNHAKGINETCFFVVIKKMYFDQFGHMQVKYKKGTFSYCKSETIIVPFLHCNALFEYIKL